MNPSFPPISLVANGLYLNQQGDVVRVDLISPSHRIFHGSNDRVYFCSGLVVDPHGRDPSTLRPDDLVVDVLHIPDDYPALPADAELALARFSFQVEVFDAVYPIFELNSVIPWVCLGLLIDKWLLDRPRYARWREFLLNSFTLKAGDLND